MSLAIKTTPPILPDSQTTHKPVPLILHYETRNWIPNFQKPISKLDPSSTITVKPWTSVIILSSGPYTVLPLTLASIWDRSYPCLPLPRWESIQICSSLHLNSIVQVIWAMILPGMIKVSQSKFTNSNDSSPPLFQVDFSLSHRQFRINFFSGGK